MGYDVTNSKRLNSLSELDRMKLWVAYPEFVCNITKFKHETFIDEVLHVCNAIISNLQ